LDAMNKYLAIPLFILSWTLGPSQDLIVTRSGDTLIGEIVYESPKHFRIKNLRDVPRLTQNVMCRIRIVLLAARGLLLQSGAKCQIGVDRRYLEKAKSIK